MIKDKSLDLFFFVSIGIIKASAYILVSCANCASQKAIRLSFSERKNCILLLKSDSVIINIFYKIYR